MRFIVAVLTLALLTGCGGIYAKKTPHGYTSYDPCITCGEGWIFIPRR